MFRSTGSMGKETKLSTNGRAGSRKKLQRLQFVFLFFLGPRLILCLSRRHQKSWFWQFTFKSLGPLAKVIVIGVSMFIANPWSKDATNPTMQWLPLLASLHLLQEGEETVVAKWEHSWSHLSGHIDERSPTCCFLFVCGSCGWTRIQWTGDTCAAFRPMGRASQVRTSCR